MPRRSRGIHVSFASGPGPSPFSCRAGVASHLLPRSTQFWTSKSTGKLLAAQSHHRLQTTQLGRVDSMNTTGTAMGRCLPCRTQFSAIPTPGCPVGIPCSEGRALRVPLLFQNAEDWRLVEVVPGVSGGCLKTPPGSRVSAHGLQDSARSALACRPGPPTGRTCNQAQTCCSYRRLARATGCWIATSLRSQQNRAGGCAAARDRPRSGEKCGLTQFQRSSRFIPTPRATTPIFFRIPAVTWEEKTANHEVV
jgi:hypothetical protein